jgi:hypothetical protein
VRSAESNRERDAEVEHLVGSGRLPKGPAVIFGDLSPGWIALKKNERPHPRSQGQSTPSIIMWPARTKA